MHEPAAPCDRGRTALGEAEHVAFGGTDLERPRDVAELAAWAGAVTGRAWWSAAGGPEVVVVAARASARSSSARGEAVVEIRVAPGQQDRVTVAHELAHALAGIAHGHDEYFRAAFIDVVGLSAGPEAADGLRGALAVLGLAVATRPWPPPARWEGEGFLVR